MLGHFVLEIPSLHEPSREDMTTYIKRPANICLRSGELRTVLKLCVKKARKSVNNFTLLFKKKGSSRNCKQIRISLVSAAWKRNWIVHQMQMLNAYCSCFGQRSSPSKNQCQSVKDEISPYIIFTSYLYWLLLSLKQRSRSLAFFPVIWRWNGRFVWTRSYESDQNLR